MTSSPDKHQIRFRKPVGQRGVSVSFLPPSAKRPLRVIYNIWRANYFWKSETTYDGGIKDKRLKIKDSGKRNHHVSHGQWNGRRVVVVVVVVSFYFQRTASRHKLQVYIRTLTNWGQKWFTAAAISVHSSYRFYIYIYIYISSQHSLVV